MTMDADTAFAVIGRAIEAFQATVVRVRSDHAASEQTLAAVEYELAQMKMLMAEISHKAPPALAAEVAPSGLEVTGQDVASRLLGGLSRAA